MPQDSSPRPGGKLSWVAPAAIAIALLLVVAFGMLIRRPQTPPEPAPAAPAAVAPTAPTPTPLAGAEVGRRDLLLNAAETAAEFAGGDHPDGRNASLVGRPFSVRIPFGCDGPQVAAGAAQAFYEFDPERRTVRLVARPGDWTSLPVLQPLASTKTDGAEGFWIPRPWTYADSCPSRREQPVPAAPTPPAAPTLGFVRIFTPNDTRTTRHVARPYEHVVKLGDGATPTLWAGYRLHLEGKFAAFPGGGATRCWSESPDHRPICVYAVDFTRVAFERPDGELIAEWRD